MKQTLHNLSTLVVAAVAMLGGLDAARAQATNDAPVPPRASSSASVWYGVGGCVAANCHGGGALPGGEYTHWFNFDTSHRRAYAVLLEPRAKEMAAALGPTPAHEDRRCLACHSMKTGAADQELGPLFAVEYGVGCESCHGAAGAWVALHTQSIWKGQGGQPSLTKEQKAAYGFRDTKDMATRADSCVVCHVGSPNATVDHDLIAAGHPRLNFELAAYQAHEPHHWNDKRLRNGDPSLGIPGDKSYEARLWLIGQLKSAQATVEVLAARADEQSRKSVDNVTADFADYDCHACHHDLADESWRRSPGHTGSSLGLPQFGTWYFSTARQVASQARDIFGDEGGSANQSLGEVEDLFTQARLGGVSHTKLAPAARKAAEDLKKLAEIARNHPLEPAQLRNLLTLVTSSPVDTLNWDEATQHYLAVAAIARSLADHRGEDPDSLPRRSIDGFVQRLRYPAGFDTPRGFTPAGLETLFGTVRTTYLQN